MTHEVAPGRVDDLAGDLLPACEPGALYVALGGGASSTRRRRWRPPPRAAAAVPTTLSAAEMTWLHRRARDAPPSTGLRVPRGPERSAPVGIPAAAGARRQRGERPGPRDRGDGDDADQPRAAARRAGCGASSRARAARRRAGSRGARARGAPVGLRDRRGVVRAAPRARADPRALRRCRARTRQRHAAPADDRRPAPAAPEALADLDAAIGERAEDVALRFARLAGATRLRDIGVAEDDLATCASQAAGRDELALTPRVRTATRSRPCTAAW